jgi:3-hydroxypropanoate dehydrogenase
MSTETLFSPSRISEESLKTIFTEARTLSKWSSKPVSEDTLRELYNILRLGPTSANLAPARFVFLTSVQAKDRLVPALASGNVEKTQKAPVTVIVAYDTSFYEHGKLLFPVMDILPWFEGKPDAVASHAGQNANLQAAYLIIAARALGLDAGPMGGFDATAVDQEFFPDGKMKTLLLINLGYGDRSDLYPRLPRLEFDQASTIL